MLPLLGEQTFGIGSRLAVLTFVASFGATKAIANLAAGGVADRIGRRRVLLTGWAFGLLAPVIVIFAPTWEWVVLANAILGVQQGLCWSMTVIMKVDLVGPARRGLALGVNESAGYVAVAVAAFAGAAIAEATALRPEPFIAGAAVAAVGALLSLGVRDTRPQIRLESARSDRTEEDASLAHSFAEPSWRHPALFSASQAGFANNLNDGIAWGLLPSFFLAGGLSLREVGIAAAAYPIVWGLAQLGAGALSDVTGRRPLIVAGMLVQALAFAAVVPLHGFGPWLAAMSVLGLGTALVYPTLLAVVSDVVPAERRATASGVYRFWRDAGYVCGALVGGVFADAFGVAQAIELVAAITLGSGILAFVRLPETRSMAP